MKITLGPISIDILLLLRLCVPTIVFIGFCTGVLFCFRYLLLWLDQAAPDLIGWSWLSLLVFYIVIGIAFILLIVRLLRRSFGVVDIRVQRRRAIASGIPFYAVCLLFLLSSIVCIVFPDMLDTDMLGAVQFFNLAGFVGFALISFCYILLTLLFLGRPTAIARSEEGV